MPTCQSLLPRRAATVRGGAMHGRVRPAPAPRRATTRRRVLSVRAGADWRRHCRGRSERRRHLEACDRGGELVGSEPTARGASSWARAWTSATTASRGSSMTLRATATLPLPAPCDRSNRASTKLKIVFSGRRYYFLLPRGCHAARCSACVAGRSWEPGAVQAYVVIAGCSMTASRRSSSHGISSPACARHISRPITVSRRAFAYDAM